MIFWSMTYKKAKLEKFKPAKILLVEENLAVS
jgi:hypothetical protein